ncbi:glycosyltransferase family 18 protein [Mixia osmundae IAM 14324]|uniref:alpha-1,6-mannosyl-glycoprotein 6-beta-N-acetylglucosaminyltransferase n=1 Tax=Mixia osmundae (strain CBS 9802 / IAM 14324 / JCM 22182 / KY 12970) TaxID=764103 RepID=G7DVS3_MIXOS|nr:glycosyltransferase family 18 protein [Mixia osmundae IAM 14324]KEI39636.1 glycosyltransferase family 18 protein [Mixia osmundae IAM 14324]GAA94683.1 hypothetical protein E5Q_01336 [Mixia osmundae IAM 14324]
MERKKSDDDASQHTRLKSHDSGPLSPRRNAGFLNALLARPSYDSRIPLLAVTTEPEAAIDSQSSLTTAVDRRESRPSSDGSVGKRASFGSASTPPRARLELDRDADSLASKPIRYDTYQRSSVTGLPYSPTARLFGSVASSTASQSWLSRKMRRRQFALSAAIITLAALIYLSIAHNGDHATFNRSMRASDNSTGWSDSDSIWDRLRNPTDLLKSLPHPWADTQETDPSKSWSIDSMLGKVNDLHLPSLSEWSGQRTSTPVEQVEPQEVQVGQKEAQVELQPDQPAWDYAEEIFAPPKLLNATSGERASEPEWHTRRRRTLAMAAYCRRNPQAKCPERMSQVVLIGVGRFKWALDGTFDKPSPFANGEAILAMSFLYGLDKREYPYIYVEDNYPRTERDVVLLISRLYAELQESVKMVILDYITEPMCLDDSTCIRSDVFPTGMPRWKIFVWDAMANIMNYEDRSRADWHITAVPSSKTVIGTFLGITISTECSKFQIVPSDQRNHSAYVLGKQRDFFAKSSLAWTAEDLAELKNATGLDLIAGVKQPKDENDYVLPDAIRNIGAASRDDFITRIGSAKVMLGVGLPTDSPSPFEALCMGTPVVFPVRKINGWQGDEWDGDLTHFNPQSKLLADSVAGEPHVYHVVRGDRAGLIKAVQKAISTPIDPYLAPVLSDEKYLERFDGFMSKDWYQAHLDIQEFSVETQ